MATHAKQERFQLGEKKFENFDSHSPKSTSETTLFEHQQVVKVLGAAICLQAQRGRCKSI
jgi:hypothetical protein